MKNWRIRYSATVGPAGIDYEQITPWCTGPDCLSCRHIKAAEESNKDKDGKVVDKHHKKTIDRVKSIHKGEEIK